MFLYRRQECSDNRFYALLHTGQALFMAGKVFLQFVQFAILGPPPEKIRLYDVSRPNAELRCPFRVDSVSYGNNDVKIVVLQRPPDLPPGLVLQSYKNSVCACL